MNQILNNIQNIFKQIQAYEQRYHRDHKSVKLLAVTKGQSLASIKQAWEAGLNAFGENYLQEALPKIKALPEAEWHYIGAIQSNKTRDIAENFSWVHSVSRLSIAQHLHEKRPAHLPPLNICVQVNVSQEASKSGISLSELYDLIASLKTFSRLHMRGLMTMLPANIDFEKQRQLFHETRQAYHELINHGFTVDTLSMGMSHDFEAAIAEGATLLRIGTAVFGNRI